MTGEAVYHRSMEQDKLSIGKCRELLGESAESLNDEQVEHLRDGLYSVGDALFDTIQATDTEHVRWTAYMNSLSDSEFEALQKEEQWEAQLETAWDEETQ